MLNILFEILSYTNKRNHSEAYSFSLLTILPPLFESRNPVCRDFCLEMDDIDSSGVLEVCLTS